MSEANLNQIVKGAPNPNVSKAQVAAAAASKSPNIRNTSELNEEKKPNLNHTDPLSLLPSSPPQIYLNLLILEASLRSQYLTLRARRRQHTFFLFLLSLWIAGFFYALFIRPREDGSGIGGSVYWVVDMAEKVAFMGGIFTAVLIWATGQWERGVRWPRRWVGITNRGLRGMNLKIVVLKGPWWKRLISYLAFLFPYSSFFPSQGSSYHYIEYPDQKDSLTPPGLVPRNSMKEEDIASGGDHIKLLLLPKQFSPEFRDNWELYRTEYWDRENERRAELRKLVKKRERELAKQQGGWLWWTGWRGWKRVGKSRGESARPGDVEKLLHSQHARKISSRDGRRRSPSLLQAGASHSRSSSRSSFAAGSDFEDGQAGSISGASSTRSGSRKARSSRSGAAAVKSSSSHRKRLSDLRDNYSEQTSQQLASLSQHQQYPQQDRYNVTRTSFATADWDKRASMASNASSSGLSDGEMSERSTTSVASSSRDLSAAAATRMRTRQMRDSLLLESD